MKSKHDKIPSSFDETGHMTELSAVLDLVHWMRNIIEDNNLDLGLPDAETIGRDRKRPDAVIYESKNSKKVLCVIEAKRPGEYDVFDEEQLKDPARKKANQRKAKYFATTNFKTLVLFDTRKSNEQIHDIKGIYELSELKNLDDIKQDRYSIPTKRSLEKFLKELYLDFTGKEPLLELPIDITLVFRIYGKIDLLSDHYKRIIDVQFHKDSQFKKKLRKWFDEQKWNFHDQPQYFEKAARQAAYLLCNKILFYNVIQRKRQKLDKLEISPSRTIGSQLQTELRGYFDQVLKIDYETIYEQDFLDDLAFPESKEVVKEIKELVQIFERYDLSSLKYDIIGKIFERLIPEKERHNLGQYFTNDDIVDIILSFCHNHENDIVFDPSCGAGTFLVRAYQHKKVMNSLKEHEEILKTLWGNDIAKFPAHLATINLAIKGLEYDENYPNIIQDDFFTLMVGDKGFEPEKWSRKRAHTLGIQEREVEHPRWFDAIVGNPPYTRQEEIPDIGVDKGKLIKNALYHNGKKLADISKRAGIHAYFFVHGTKFLVEGGYFGFIVSNSWLDVDYGKGLQEFFLKNYKIVTIIESKVERWFEEADINTCIIILQKCSDSNERDKNLVRFVYLKKPLRQLLPPAQDEWKKQVKRLHTIEDLKKTILAHNDFYENDDLRIFPISQKELWEEGFDPEENKFVGAKWGKYLRAPKIFFTILEKGKGKLVPLKEVAKVRRGFTTGANEFFYLTEDEIKRRKIEKEFWMHQDENGNWVPNYVIKSPRECKSIVVKPEDLKYRVLMVHKDREDLKGTQVLKYIREGIRKKFNKRPTCASRGEKWYDLGVWKKPDLIWSDAYNDRYGVYDTQRTWADKRFFYIYLKNRNRLSIYHAFLNSSIIPLIIEIDGITNLGEGAVYTNVYQLKKLGMPIERIKARKKFSSILNELGKRTIVSIFDELGAYSADEVSYNNIKPDRRELDKIIMGDILGLTDDEQLEVYRAVVDLVRSRLDKARSFGKKDKIEGFDTDIFSVAIKDKVKRVMEK